MQSNSVHLELNLNGKIYFLKKKFMKIILEILINLKREEFFYLP